MNRSLLLCGLLLSAPWVAPLAQAQEGVGVSEIHAPPPARNWGERSQLIQTADLIEIQAVVRVKGAPDRRVSLTRTSPGTVGCVIAADACGPLSDLGLVDMPVGALLDLLVANVPHHPAAGPIDTPQSFRIQPPPRSHRSPTVVQFSQWSFNPEAGMKMPGQIALTHEGRVIHFQVERFLLVRRSVPTL